MMRRDKIKIPGIAKYGEMYTKFSGKRKNRQMKDSQKKRLTVFKTQKRDNNGLGCRPV